MQKIIIKYMLFYSLCLFLIGCGPSKFYMNFEGFSNPDLDIVEYKKFAFLPLNPDYPLKEKQLFLFVKNIMEQRGFIFDDKQPQFLISIKTSERSDTEVRPVKSRRVSTHTPAPIGSNINNYGKWQTSYETTGGGSTTISTLTLMVSFIDSNKKDPNGSPVYIWQGQASSSQKVKMKVGHRTGVENCLILGILQEYPNAQTSKRTHVLSEQCN